MHSFYRATTRHPKTMVLLFALLAAACALCKPLIAVNYDMTIICRRTRLPRWRWMQWTRNTTAACPTPA